MEIYTERAEAGPQAAAVREGLDRLNRTLAQIRARSGTASAENEVLFLPRRAKDWGAMESLWKAVNEDPAFQAVVVPVPWVYRNGLEQLEEEIHEDTDQFPSYVPVQSWRTFSFAHRFPRLIVNQTPYDQCNYAWTVLPQFYSAHLRGMTRNLLYIPWFLTDEIDFDNPGHGRAVYNMRYYVTVPGVVYADMVVTQSERMRRTYIEVLTEMGGEETRPVWERKIKGYGSPAMERSTGTGYEDVPVSGLWSKIREELR